MKESWGSRERRKTVAIPKVTFKNRASQALIRDEVFVFLTTTAVGGACSSGRARRLDKSLSGDYAGINFKLIVYYESDSKSNFLGIR